MNNLTKKVSDIMYLDNQKYKLIGFMRNSKTPPYIAKLTAKMCVYQGIILIYLRPSDIDMVTHQVTGKIYINNSWEKATAKIPEFIDISPYCMTLKNKSIIQYLMKHTQLSNETSQRFEKEKLQTLLQKSDKFSHLVIPTRKANKLNDMMEFVNKYTTIVIKPIGGERGKGVYILRKDKQGFKLGYQKHEEDMSEEDLRRFFKTKIEKNRYILQKYINSRSAQNDPFDCRVHVEKNGSGKWVSARNFIRIGIGQKVVSNVSQGGGISDVKPFLKANFGEGWEEINNNLNRLAVTLPYKLEKLKKSKFMTLGMDIGIDKDGSLYLFEVNTAPITKPLRDIAVSLRVDYYAYMLNIESLTHTFSTPLNLMQNENKMSLLEEENKLLSEEICELKKENARLEKKAQQIENSFSWKLSKPFRIIEKALRRLK